jgi:hypothetical protein
MFLEKQLCCLKPASSVFLVVWVLSLGKNDTRRLSNVVRINTS